MSMSFFGLSRGGVEVCSGVSFPLMGKPPFDATMTLSEVLHSARLRQPGLTQEKAAARAKLSSKTVQRIEKGAAATAELDSVLRLADAVGVSRALVRDMRMGLPANVTPPDSQMTHTGHASAGETRGRQEDTAVDRLLGTVRHYLEQMSVEDQNKAGVHFLEYLQTLDSFPSGDTPGRRVANQH